MVSSVEDILTIDPDDYRRAFNTKPIGFEHNLHRLPMFAAEALPALAGRFADHPGDFFVAGSAPTPGTRFYDVKHGMYKPHEALGHLDEMPMRVLLKRLENHDSAFSDLLQALCKKVIELRGGLRGEKIVRLESSLLISSAASTTPFHFDPEVNHFFQIEGPKSYHVFAPSAVNEAELERFYARGVVDIGQLDLKGCDPAQEHVFELKPGRGFHQPQDAPHWVQTGTIKSVSYAFVYETDAGRARGRVRAANRYLRAMGMTPQHPGPNPSADKAKAAVMRVMTPTLNRMTDVVRRVAKR